MRVNTLATPIHAERPMLRDSTYTEVLQIVNGEGVPEEVQQSVLEHAAVAVTVKS